MKKLHIRTHAAVVLALLLGIAILRLTGWIEFFAPAWLAALLLLPLFTWISLRSIAGLPSRTGATALTLRSILFILLTLCL